MNSTKIISLLLVSCVFFSAVCAYTVESEDENVTEEVAPAIAVDSQGEALADPILIAAVQQFTETFSKATVMDKTITDFPCGASTTYTDINILNYAKTLIFCTGPQIGSSGTEYMVGRSITQAWADDATCQWRMTYCPVGYDQTLVTFTQTGGEHINCVWSLNPKCFRYYISGTSDLGQYFTRSTLTSSVTLLSPYNSGSTNTYAETGGLMTMTQTAPASSNFKLCALGSWNLSTC
jgi:hypothetical protein